MLACAPGCGCERPHPPGMGGFFTEILNVVGAATIGVPIGSVAASQALPGYAPVTQTPDQIAAAVAPKVVAAIGNPGKAAPDPRSQAIAQAAAAQIAAKMAVDGYSFPAGTVGAELQHPNVLDAFGGGTRQLVEIGLGALGVLLLIKVIK